MRHINVVLSYSPSLSKSFSGRACVCVHACMHVRVRACVCVSEAAPYLWNVRTVLCYFHFIFVTWFPLSCCSQKTWGRLQRHEPSEQLMTPCFLAPCVTIWGLWPADDTMFPGSVCDNLRLVTSWWHHVSWLRVWQFEACDQLMTPCFLAPCVTIWGLWPADDTMFPGSVCDNLRLVTSWWHHVSWLRVWQFEACDQLMTPCFLAPCVTIWGLWPADDTMFPGSVCDNLRLVTSWWHHVSWLRVWQFEACDQLMTPCFLAPCVTIWGLWPADDTMFPGSVCDNLRLVTSWWHHVSWLRVWQFEACDQLMTPCFLAPCVTIWGLWPADDTMFPGSVCDNLRLVTSWWHHVSWLRVWQFEACDQLMTPCFLAPCVTIWGLWPADDTMFPGSVCDNLRLVTSWWHHVSWLRVWQFEACDQLMTPCFLAPCVTIWGLWPADDTMFPGSVCDNLRLVTSWWHHVSWLRVWQFEACDQLMTLCFLDPCVTNRVLWAADDTMFSGSVREKLSLVNSWWPCFLALCMTNRNPVCLDVKCLAVVGCCFLCMWNLPPLLSSEKSIHDSLCYSKFYCKTWSVLKLKSLKYFLLLLLVLICLKLA